MPIHVKRVKARLAGHCQCCKWTEGTAEDVFVISHGRRDGIVTNVRLCSQCLNELEMGVHNAQLNHAAGTPAEENTPAPPIRDWGELTKADDPSIQVKTRAASLAYSSSSLFTPAFRDTIAAGRTPRKCPQCGRKLSIIPSGIDHTELKCGTCGFHTRIIKKGDINETSR